MDIQIPDEAQLVAAAQLMAPHQRAQVLGHLRWHARTPYAMARVLLFDDRTVGYCTAVRFGASARIARIFLHPELRGQLRGAVLAESIAGQLELSGAESVHVQCAPEQVGFWEHLGFVRFDRFVRYGGGLFLEALRDEVLLLEPVHTLALLHMDRKATGEDRAPLILEHRYAAQGYVDQGRLLGGLLPVLGHGLLVADEPHVGLELQRWLLPVQEHIIVPEANTAACAHLHERNYRVESSSVRLVRGAVPDFRPELVYAWPW